MKSIRIIVLAAASLVAMSAVAQSAPPAGSAASYDQRYAKQTERINKGEASGQLTQQEAQRLRQREERLHNASTKAAADGKITPQERRRLDHAYNQQSKAIAHERRDRQHDFNHDGKVDRPRDRVARNQAAKK